MLSFDKSFSLVVRLVMLVHQSLIAWLSVEGGALILSFYDEVNVQVFGQFSSTGPLSGLDAS